MKVMSIEGGNEEKYFYGSCFDIKMNRRTVWGQRGAGHACWCSKTATEWRRKEKRSEWK